ncbi:MAG: DUF5671 domain-containing protein [Patescibacteria group bacterium]
MENIPNQTTKPLTSQVVKGPKALFWYLALFFTLGITAFSTGGLWFQFINKWFGTEINYGQAVRAFSQSAIKWEMASLIVSVPVFFIFTLLVRKALKNGSLAPDNKVRLWVTYIILFIVIAVSVGDLIATTFSLLNGDFTVRFLLKSLTILVIAIWMFVYYWLEIRSHSSLTDSKLPKIMGIITLAVVIVSFIGTFFIIESPVQARKNAFDRTRVNDLQNIKYAVDSYYQEFNKLPTTLDELIQSRGYLNIIDPETAKPYEYKSTGSDSYQLCAQFSNSNKGQVNDYYNYPNYNEFLHDAGHSCFDRKAVSADQPAKMLQKPSPQPQTIPAN